MSSNQRIGFGKKVRWDWLVLALRLRAQDIPFESAKHDLGALIAETNAGKVAITKSLSNLRQVVFEPVPPLVDFAARGVSIYRNHGASAAFPVLWGLCNTAYSFFSQTSETIGRLLRLNDDFTTAEMVKRVKERAGDRAFVGRVARFNLSSILDWELLSYDPKSKRYRRGKTVPVADAETLGWLAESVLIASGKRTLPQAQVFTSNLLFPFDIKPTAPAQIVAANRHLQVVRESLTEELLSLDLH